SCRERLLAAGTDERARREAEAMWRERLNALLLQAPTAATELTALLQAVAPREEQFETHTEIRQNHFFAPSAFNSGGGDQHVRFGD
ncbi:MAG: hypothetical protein ACRDRL_22085, partial [Sciscionella sp.]